MEKCKICGKELIGAVKSAEKEDKSYYIICRECNNVMYVTVDENGLTTINRTLEGNSQETMEQMIEAKGLFEDAGVYISDYIGKVNTEKKPALDLEEKGSDDSDVLNEECIGCTDDCEYCGKYIVDDYDDDEEICYVLEEDIESLDEVSYVIALRIDDHVEMLFANTKEEVNEYLSNTDYEVLKVFSLEEVDLKEDVKTIYQI